MIAKQKMVKNVFSHSIMKEQHILHVHQLAVIIHGVLMKLIVTEISLVMNGKIVMLLALNYGGKQPTYRLVGVSTHDLFTYLPN